MDIIQFGQSNNVRAFSILASRLQSIEAKINGLTSTLSDDESKILAALTASTTDPAILAQAVVTALENQGVPIDVTIDHEQLKIDFLAVLQGLVFKAQ
jgi:alanine dehydrogenase